MKFVPWIVALLGITACQGSKVSSRAANLRVNAVATSTTGTETTTSVTQVQVETVGAPTFSPAADTYNTAQTITMSSPTEGATLYYTNDGSTPTTASTLYSGPVTVSTSQTIKVLAVKTGANDSAVASAEYIITGTVAAPSITPAAGTYTTAQSVTLSTITSGATIYYSSDGSTPTTASTLYSGTITVSASQTIKAFAVKAASTDSSIASAAYVITGTVATPSFSVAAGTYASAQSVTITSATAGATLYYTTDGSVPTTASAVYSGAIPVAASQTLKALAVKATWNDSAVAAAAYIITGTVAAPTFTPAAGTYTTSQSVTLNTITGGATIYYTTDGSTPTTASTVYSGAITVSASQTLKAFAVKPASTDSSVASSAYVITGTVATPSFSVAAGTYTSSQSVTITSATAVATLYYTTDGSTPTTSSTVYSGAITVSASQTLKALAVKATWADSAVASAVYVIDTTPPTITYTSISPASPNWSETPTLTLTLSEAASVTLYSNAGCTTAISASATLASGSGQTIAPNNLATIAKTNIYGKAIDSVGNTSSCTSLVVYSHIMKLTLPDDPEGNGYYVYELPNGNFVVSASRTTINGNIYSGVVYLFNGSTGALISRLYGSTPDDNVGNQIIVLSNGNFVVSSYGWDCQSGLGCSGAVIDAGAVTWGSATTGVNGPVSDANSLIGSSYSDSVYFTSALPNGNYVVSSGDWDCTVAAGCSGAIADVGAVTWGSGTSGVSGPITTSNSLVGSTAGDTIGKLSWSNGGITVLTNGNYVVSSQYWDCTVAAGCASTLVDAGAATWVSGSSAVVGTITTANSLVGSTASDKVGSNIYALTNGNYVVTSIEWNCKVSAGCSGAIGQVGAATWGSGTTGITGVVTTSNSLVGSGATDFVGWYGVTPLSNGNYVVRSPSWSCKVAAGCSGAVNDVGAITWASGTTGRSGSVSTSNSLIGATASDQLGYAGVVALSNGSYVVSSPKWDCKATAGCSGTITDVGAVTWGSGTAGITGAVTTTNSLVGSTASDGIGAIGGNGANILALTNGNYVVLSPNWDCKVSAGCAAVKTDVGAATWGSGTAGVNGLITSSNSLIGSSVNDMVGGYLAATPLSNGNYVIFSNQWDCTVSAGCAGAVSDVGAITWGSGTSGVSGSVSTSNSFVGSATSNGLWGYPLDNGNYVITQSMWDCTVAAGCSANIGTVGAVTWASGTTGIVGTATATNSFIGSSAGDQVGYDGIQLLSNGNYVISSSPWNCTIIAGCASNSAAAGAATWSSSAAATTGTVSTANSIVGAGTAQGTLNNGKYFLHANGISIYIVPGSSAVTGSLL